MPVVKKNTKEEEMTMLPPIMGWKFSSFPSLLFYESSRDHGIEIIMNIIKKQSYLIKSFFKCTVLSKL